jgi:rod shape-determining protein MreD
VKYLIAAAVAWFLAVLDVSAVARIEVLGVTPNLVLIFAACWTVVRGPNEGMIVVPVAGLMQDLSTSDPVGTAILGFAPIVPLAAAARMRSIDTDFLPSLFVVAAGSLCFGVIQMAVLSLTGDEISASTALLRVVLPGAIVNTLFTPIIYLPVRWLSPRHTRTPLTAGNLPQTL